MFLTIAAPLIFGSSLLLLLLTCGGSKKGAGAKKEPAKTKPESQPPTTPGMQQPGQIPTMPQQQQMVTPQQLLQMTPEQQQQVMAQQQQQQLKTMCQMTNAPAPAAKPTPLKPKVNKGKSSKGGGKQKKAAATKAKSLTKFKQPPSAANAAQTMLPKDSIPPKPGAAMSQMQPTMAPMQYDGQPMLFCWTPQGLVPVQIDPSMFAASQQTVIQVPLDQKSVMGVGGGAAKGGEAAVTPGPGVVSNVKTAHIVSEYKASKHGTGTSVPKTEGSAKSIRTAMVIPDDNKAAAAADDLYAVPDESTNKTIEDNEKPKTLDLYDNIPTTTE